MLFLENSLYTNPQEKDALLKDKEKVANAFFINFLGTLGLFSISSSRGIMKNYFPDDNDVELVRIGDANKDTSLAVKLYHEIGGLKTDTANKISRLLKKIKTRAITSKTFDENVIREIVSEINYTAHRPHPLILDIVKQFEAGNANLKQVSKAFFNLIKARKKEFLPVSQEFYAIARQYAIYLKDIPNIGATPSANVAANIDGDITSQQVSSSNTISTPSDTKVESDEEFYLRLWKATSKREINKILKERNYSGFDSELLLKATKYLLPKERKDYFDKVISSMPSISEFNNAFGSYLKSLMPGSWKSLMFYILSQSKDVDELKEKLDQIGSFSYKIMNFNDVDINGQNMFVTVQKCAELIREGFVKKVIDIGPGEDVQGKVRKYALEFERIMRNLHIPEQFAALKHYLNYATQFSIDDKIKFFVVFLVANPNDDTGTVDELVKLLDKKGIKYNSKSWGRFRSSVHILEYEKLFPDAKQCIDTWKINPDGCLTFGPIVNENIYAKIAKKWHDLQSAIAKDINMIPDSESDEEVARKILNEINKLNLSGEDRNVLFTTYCFLHSNLINHYDERVKNIMINFSILLCEQFRKEFEEGKFVSIEKDKYYVKEIGDIILFNFSNGGYPHNLWDAFRKMLEKLIREHEGLKQELLKYALSNYNIMTIDRFLRYANKTWDYVMKYVLDNPSTWTWYTVGEIFADPRSKPYMTDSLYKYLGQKLDILKFAKICKNHGINVAEYADYQNLFNITKYYLVDSINSEIDNDLLTFMFNSLKEPEKEKILESLKEKVFIPTRYTIFKHYFSINHFKRLTKLVSKEYLINYTKNLSKNARLTWLYEDPFTFFEYMKDAEVLNKTLEDFIKTIPLSSFPVLILEKALENVDNISLDNTKKIFEIFSKYDENKHGNPEYYERGFCLAMKLLMKKDLAEANEKFEILPIGKKQLIAKSIANEKFVKAAIEHIMGDGVPIKPEEKLTEARLLEILKYNNVKPPRKVTIKEKDTLDDVLAKIKIKPEVFGTLYVEPEQLSEEELERRSVEYDALNRYAHGGIAVKFIRSFNVNLPIQEEGFRKWLEKMKEEGIDPRIMKPVFHGTGSVGASMILRFGFRILSKNAQGVVGRMLGNGIYFSNVLDKVAQYLPDTGFSRELGTRGYIFEMEASLGKHRRDFLCAGTGTPEDSHDTVSPEWAVFHPNEQLRIYKAHFVETITKKDMDMLKQKHLGINESAIIEIKTFKEFINEGKDDMKHCITYIFMDGTIPVSRDKVVDFEDFDSRKFGKHVRLDWTGSGPSVMIYNNKESKTYLVRFTKELMQNRDEFEKYLNLLKG